MPGVETKSLTGYYQTEYSSAWPGLVTNLPSSRIPPGACFSCDAMVVRGRLTGQPSLTPVFGSGGLPVVFPAFVAGENICVMANLQPPGAQLGFTVIITNMSVYIDYLSLAAAVATKTFVNIFNFPVPYPTFARFGTCVIGDVLYFSSGSLLGVYALKPVFTVASIEILNPGGYFTSPPTVIASDGGGIGSGLNGFLTATQVGGNLTSVTISPNTATYLTPPLISFNGGSTAGPQPGQSNAVAVGILSSTPVSYRVVEVTAFTGVASVNLTASGTGYVNPMVAFIGGGGSGAIAQVVLNSSNNISGIAMVSPGQNYTSVPTVQIYDAGGMGTGATATAVLFQGLPFIGGDFMTSMAQRLILANIIGGDGNDTFDVADVIVTNGGGGYTHAPNTLDFPTVVFSGGGGSGASGFIFSTVLFDSIPDVMIGEFAQFHGGTTSGTPNIFGVTPLTGIRVGMTIFGPGLFAPGTTVVSIAGNTLTMSNPALGTASIVDFTYGYFIGDSGNGYYSTPAVTILTSGNGTGATAIAQLSPTPRFNSSATHYPDRIAWSAPNAPGFFDPNYQIAPGGFDTLTEARGLIASVNVVESVGFVGHNGGITEMTPNTSSGVTPFSFYPLWSADVGVVVRYGSMAQYGSTLAFLSNDSAYTMTPNGLQEIGMNIGNVLQDSSTWNDGAFPLQGLYGSIVLIEGEKHYLIGLASDNPRTTQIYDYNMNESSWHQWNYPNAMTCPIYQSFDTQAYQPVGGPPLHISRDAWILIGANLGSIFELAPLTRYIQIASEGGTPVTTILTYQFRSEAPSIAKMQQNRRILVEYENQTVLAGEAVNPSLTLTYTGQQDPTDQTGTVSQQQTSTRILNQIATSTIPGQVLTTQADFGTFTGVCTSLELSASGTDALVALVRLTQVADLPKAQTP